MPLTKVAYRSSDESLVTEQGSAFDLDETGDGFIAPLSHAVGVGLSSLSHALGHFADNHHSDTARLALADVAPEHLDDSAPVEPVEIVWKGGELLIDVSVVSDEEPPPTEKLIAALRTTLERRHARVVRSERSELPRYRIVRVQVAFPIRGKSVGDAHEFGHDCIALLHAAVSGDLDVASATELVKSGRAELLIGHYESNWLEVKAAPYRDSPAGRIELAKDVVTLANARGGVLLIGLKTKRDTHGDRIKAVNECVLADVPIKRYRGVVKQTVYPEAKGARVTHVEGRASGRGVVVIEIPSQDEGDKPFLVHGTLVGDRVEGAYFGLPVRAGDEAEFTDIRIIHGWLRAGKNYLAGNAAPAAPDLDQRLRAVEDAAVPDFLRHVVRLAERHGIAVERGRESIQFTGPREEVIVASTASSGPLADQLARERLLDQLSRFGLPVRRTASGFLVPDVAI